MQRFIPIMIALFVVAGVAPGHAATIQKRQAKEAHRVNKGEKRGQLTPKESSRLRNQQNLIAIERSQAKMDGKITQRERSDIHHDQNRLSKDIKHKRHNQRRVYQ